MKSITQPVTLNSSTPKQKLSVVLCVRNEEQNIAKCLESVKTVTDEIVVVDEKSTDNTSNIARRFGARVIEVEHEDNFHINKQKAIDTANGDWILQLDADERVSPKLAEEIKEIINSSNEKLLERTIKFLRNGDKPVTRNPQQIKLFIKHQQLIEKREGTFGKSTGEVVAFFIPRFNYFLGAPLEHAGVYPDGVIRLFKKGQARLPGKSVHELMEVDGEVGWLFNPLEHHESPTFERYLDRANRYTDLLSEDFKKEKIPVNAFYLLHYSFFKPAITFLQLYLRHRGYLDGLRGFVWSLFSAFRFPIAYFKYYQTVKK